jgi:hypothetical protein
MSVQDVVKGKADLTEVRFDIIKPMLDLDKHLRQRVKAYIEIYHSST